MWEIWMKNHAITRLVSSETVWYLSISTWNLLGERRGEEGRPFLEDERTGVALWDYTHEHFVVIIDEKACSFVKLTIILSFLCSLLEPLKSKHCRAESSMMNLWIDSMICQKYRMLVSVTQMSNNYLELWKENVLGNMILSLWPCFTWKLIMIWFHKILQLTFWEVATMF